MDDDFDDEGLPDDDLAGDGELPELEGGGDDADLDLDAEEAIEPAGRPSGGARARTSTMTREADKAPSAPKTSAPKAKAAPKKAAVKAKPKAKAKPKPKPAKKKAAPPKAVKKKAAPKKAVKKKMGKAKAKGGKKKARRR